MELWSQRLTKKNQNGTLKQAFGLKKSILNISSFFYTFSYLNVPVFLCVIISYLTEQTKTKMELFESAAIYSRKNGNSNKWNFGPNSLTLELKMEFHLFASVLYTHNQGVRR